MLRNLAGPADRTLSLQWQGIAQPPQRLRDGVPLWVVAAGAVLLLAGVFAALRLSLNVQTDATFGALQALDAKTAAAPPAPPPATPAPPRLAQLLQADIAAGLVQVNDQADRSTVTVLGDTLFDPGSADGPPSAAPPPVPRPPAAPLHAGPGRASPTWALPLLKLLVIGLGLGLAFWLAQSLHGPVRIPGWMPSDPARPAGRPAPAPPAPAASAPLITAGL
jgi:hypothetical protein